MLHSLVPYLQSETTVLSLPLKFEGSAIDWKGHDLLRKEIKSFIFRVIDTVMAIQNVYIRIPRTSAYVMLAGKR